MRFRRRPVRGYPVASLSSRCCARRDPMRPNPMRCPSRAEPTIECCAVASPCRHSCAAADIAVRATLSRGLALCAHRCVAAAPAMRCTAAYRLRVSHCLRRAPLGQAYPSRTQARSSLSVAIPEQRSVLLIHRRRRGALPSRALPLPCARIVATPSPNDALHALPSPRTSGRPLAEPSPRPSVRR